MMKRLHNAALALAPAALLAACGGDAAPELPALGAKLEQTSVSGLSAGAYMAGQFQIAHSAEVVGAGIVAGGPYGCAESLYADVIPGPGTALLNLTKAINGCMLNALQASAFPTPSSSPSAQAVSPSAAASIPSRR